MKIIYVEFRVKFQEIASPSNLVVQNMAFGIRETKFCIPISFSNNCTILYSLRAHPKTPIPDACYVIIHKNNDYLG